MITIYSTWNSTIVDLTQQNTQYTVKWVELFLKLSTFENTFADLSVPAFPCNLTSTMVGFIRETQFQCS